MQKRTDEEIIYSALLRYQECCGSKKTPILSQGKVITLRAQFLQQVEKYVLLFGSSKTSIVEKRALCNKGKMLYQKYCFQLKVNPEVDTTRLAQKMDELLHFISSCEAEKFQQIRERQVAGDKIDLEQLLAEDKHIRMLINKPIDTVVSEAFSNKKYTVVGEDNAAVYMTASGAKYHRKDCPYCKGKTLMKATLLKVENIGLKPCKCIERESAVAVQERGQCPKDVENIEELMLENTMTENASEDVPAKVCIIKRPVGQKKYVTAFVDESIRVNPWRAMDESIPEKQGFYSYIICDGMLTGETLITESNTLYTGVKEVTEVRGTGDVAIEAILAVLFQLAATGYQDNVLIYTDNMGAKDYWHKASASKHLSKLFSSVMVCYIPREANRKADKLGRERAIMDLPAETMTRILGRCKGYFALKEEMNFVRSYFPVPMKNIPNLMLELRALVGAEERRH